MRKCSYIRGKLWKSRVNIQKANLRGLIVATGLVILLKSDPNRFFSPSEIWQMTSKNNRKPPPRHSVYHFYIAIHEIKSELSSGNAQIWVKSSIFGPCDLQIWRITPKNNSAHLLCHFKVCASFRSHLWIQTGVSDRKCSIWVKIVDFFGPCDFKKWRMTSENNRTSSITLQALCIIS